MPRAPAYTPRLGGRGCGNPGLIRSRAIGASCSPLRLPPVRAEVPPHRGPKEGTDDHAKSRFFDHRQSSPAIQAASFLTRRLPRESEYRAWESFCREAATRAGTDLARRGLLRSADQCRDVAAELDRPITLSFPWSSQRKKLGRFAGRLSVQVFDFVGRGSWIRTNDLQYPKLPRYQAALYPDHWECDVDTRSGRPQQGAAGAKSQGKTWPRPRRSTLRMRLV
jgi:hypothetical protein